MSGKLNKKDHEMNQVKNNMTDTMVQTVPLFSSSWVALFCILRNSLATSRLQAAAAIERSRPQATGNTPH